MTATDERVVEVAEVALLMRAIHGDSSGSAHFRGKGERAGEEATLAYPVLGRPATVEVLSGDGWWWEMGLTLRPKKRLAAAKRCAVVLRASDPEDFEGGTSPPALLMETIDEHWLGVWPTSRGLPCDEATALARSLASRLPGTTPLEEWIELPRGGDLHVPLPHDPRSHTPAVRPDASFGDLPRLSPEALLDRAMRSPLPPVGWTLREDLSHDSAEMAWTVDGLLPRGGNALLVAEAKAGKTTLAANLVRCVADGDLFLGEHAVEARGRVAYLNYEVTHAQQLAWMRAMGSRDPDRVVLASLRNARAPLTDEQFVDQLIEWLAGNDVTLLVVDPLANAHEGDENSNSEMSRLTRALDRIKADAGVDDLVVVHHAGHGEEKRARGASSLLGWPDALWTLEADYSGGRSFSARGRDVDLSRRRLHFDAETRRMTYGSSDLDPTTPIDPLAAFKQRTLDVIGARRRISAADLREAVGGNDRKKGQAKQQLLDAGLIIRERIGTAYFFSLAGGDDA